MFTLSGKIGVERIFLHNTICAWNWILQFGPTNWEKCIYNAVNVSFKTCCCTKKMFYSCSEKLLTGVCAILQLCNNVQRCTLCNCVICAIRASWSVLSGQFYTIWRETFFVVPCCWFFLFQSKIKIFRWFLNPLYWFIPVIIFTSRQKWEL